LSKDILGGNKLTNIQSSDYACRMQKSYGTAVDFGINILNAACRQAWNSIWHKNKQARFEQKL